MFYAALQSTLQLTLVTLLLLLAHGYRHLLGRAPLYLLTGAYYIFMLSASCGGADVTAPGGNCILWLPFLALLLCIYDVEGTIVAQHLFVGLIIAPFFVTLLPLLANTEMGVELYGTMTREQNMSVLVWTLIHLAFFILAPMLYQAIGNRAGRRFFGRLLCMTVTLAVYLTYSEAFQAIHTYTVLGSRAYTPPEFKVWLFRLGTAFCIGIVGTAFNIINARDYQRTERSSFSFIGALIKPFFSTERALQSLDEWSERYQIVVDNSSELIILARADGTILNANPQALQTFVGLDKPGFRLEQVIFDEKGKPWTWSDLVPAEDIHATTTPAHTAQHYTGLFLRQPGRPAAELEVNVSRILFDGRAVAVIVGRDVTLRNREERQQRDMAENRLHSQRLEALGQLAGGIAHDFNNLMQSVQASVDTLKARAFSPRYGIQDNLALLGNVDEACRRATRLTSQLLGFAHKGKFHAEDIAVQELLEHAVDLFKPGAGAIACKVLCEPVPLILNGDEIQLGQVFLNLLLNSRDALEGVEKPRIVLRAERAHAGMPEWAVRPAGTQPDEPDAFVCIHVRDNGCGMTPEVKSRIFDPFFTTKPVGKGTGMGLPMVFGAVSNHGGWLHVKTAPGEGCDIAIFLPLAGTAPQPHVTSQNT